MLSPISSLLSSLKVTSPLLASASYKWLTMENRVSTPRKLRKTSYLDTRDEDEEAIVNENKVLLICLMNACLFVVTLIISFYTKKQIKNSVK